MIFPPCCRGLGGQLAFTLFIAHSLWLPSPQEQRHDLTNTIKALLKDYNKTVSFDPWPDTAELPTCLLGCLPPSHIVGSPVLGLMGSAPSVMVTPMSLSYSSQERN